MVIWNIIFLQFRRQAWEQAIGEGISFWRWPPQTSWPTLIVFFFPQMQLFVYLPWNLFQSYVNKKTTSESRNRDLIDYLDHVCHKILILFENTLQPIQFDAGFQLIYVLYLLALNLLTYMLIHRWY